MSPGRDLDRLIAEKVMGRKVYGDRISRESPELDIPECWLPRYSTDISAAWEVLEKVCEGTDWSPQVGLKSCMMFGGFVNDWGLKPTKNVMITEAESAPHAICLAALKAMGVDV